MRFVFVIGLWCLTLFAQAMKVECLVPKVGSLSLNDEYWFPGYIQPEFFDLGDRPFAALYSKGGETVLFSTISVDSKSAEASIEVFKLEKDIRQKWEKESKAWKDFSLQHSEDGTVWIATKTLPNNDVLISRFEWTSAPSKEPLKLIQSVLKSVKWMSLAQIDAQLKLPKTEFEESQIRANYLKRIERNKEWRKRFTKVRFVHHTFTMNELEEPTVAVYITHQFSYAKYYAQENEVLYSSLNYEQALNYLFESPGTIAKVNWQPACYWSTHLFLKKVVTENTWVIDQLNKKAKLAYANATGDTLLFSEAFKGTNREWLQPECFKPTYFKASTGVFRTAHDADSLYIYRFRKDESGWKNSRVALFNPRVIQSHPAYWGLKSYSKDYLANKMFVFDGPWNNEKRNQFSVVEMGATGKSTFDLSLPKYHIITIENDEMKRMRWGEFEGDTTEKLIIFPHMSGISISSYSAYDDFDYSCFAFEDRIPNFMLNEERKPSVSFKMHLTGLDNDRLEDNHHMGWYDEMIEYENYKQEVAESKLPEDRLYTTGLRRSDFDYDDKIEYWEVWISDGKIVQQKLSVGGEAKDEALIRRRISEDPIVKLLSAISREEIDPWIKQDMNAEEWNARSRDLGEDLNDEYKLREDIPWQTFVENVFAEVEEPIAFEPVAYVYGENEMMATIARLIKYPTIAKEMDIQGTIYVRLKVDSKNAVTGINILKSVKDGGELDKEALRVIELMKNDFRAEKRNGISVDSEIVVPIKFSLR